MSLHQDPVDKTWWFTDQQGGFRGPYSSQLKAEERYREYLAFAVTAATCHHP